jgi:gas vesicle protein
MTFTLGMLVGAFIAGAVMVMLVPPEKEDWLRQWIVSQWQKLTKKG